MQIKIKIQDGKIIEGKITLLNLIKGLKNGFWSIEAKKWSNKRSVQQNKYYWVLLNVIAESTGYSPEELHQVFAHLFLPTKTIKLKSGNVTIRTSTTTLNTIEFTDYLDKVFEKASSMGIVLPLVDDYVDKIEI